MSLYFVPQKLCEDSGLLSTGNAVQSLRVHVKGHRAMWSTSAAVVWSTWLICTIDLCSLRGGIAPGKRLNLLSHVLTQEAPMYTAINLLWAWAASDYTYTAFCLCLLFFAPMVFNTSGRIWLMLKIWIFHYRSQHFIAVAFKSTLTYSHSPCVVLEYRLDRSDIEGCICYCISALGVWGSSPLQKMSTFISTGSSLSGFLINQRFRITEG